MFQKVAFFWLLLLAFPSWIVGKGFVMQIWALSWSTQPALVVSAKVDKHTSSDSQPTYIPHIVYRFQDGSAQDHLRWGTHFTTRAWARELVAQHPVGQTVSVHRNPSKPELSCLDPGLNAGDLQALALLLTFELPAIMLWFAAPGRLPVHRQGRHLRLEVGRRAPAFDAALGAMLVLFPCVFLNAMSAPTRMQMLVQLSLASLAATIGAYQRQRKNRSQESALRLERGRWVQLPHEVETIPWEQVQDWGLTREEHGDGVNFHLTLLRTDHDPRVWLTTSDMEYAERIQFWLRDLFDFSNAKG